MVDFKSEREMYPLLRKHVESAGYHAFYEFKTMQGRPDIVGFFFEPSVERSRRYSHAIFIEAKLSDWRRAIKQARAHLAYASKSYIAVPDKIASRPDRLVLARFNIGLLAVSSDNVRIIVEPRENVLDDNWHRFQFEARLAQMKLRSLSQCSLTGGCIRAICSSDAASINSSAPVRYSRTAAAPRSLTSRASAARAKT